MKNTLTIASLLALVTAFGCGKDESKDKDKGKAAGKTPAAAKAAPAAPGKTPGKSGDNTATKVGLDTGGKSLGGEPVKLNKLKFGGSGFDGEFNEALDSWTFEKWEPQADGTNDNVVTIYVGAWQGEWPADMDGFAKKLGEKDFLDYGSSWPKIDSKEAFADGWVIKGDWADDEDTEKAFAVQLTKHRVLCRGTVKAKAKDVEKTRAESIEACKGATL